MKLYKLTDHNGYTTNNTKWKVGTKIQLPIKDSPQLCTHDVIHAYRDANLGLLSVVMIGDILHEQERS